MSDELFAIQQRMMINFQLIGLVNKEGVFRAEKCKLGAVGIQR